MSPDEDRFLDCNWMEAQLVVGLLEGSGLKPCLLDAELSRMNAFYTSAVGNIKVAVPEHQFEDAMKSFRTTVEDKVWIQTMEALLLLGSMHLTPRRPRWRR